MPGLCFNRWPLVALIQTEALPPKNSRRFPPPWTIEEYNDACFIIRHDNANQPGLERQSSKCLKVIFGQSNFLAVGLHVNKMEGSP